MEAVPGSRSLKLNLHQQRPPFDLIEPPSIILAKSTNKHPSFTSFLQPNDPILPAKHKADEYSEISIFDAKKYFSDLHDQRANGTITPKQSGVSSITRLSSVSSMEDGYGGRNYRTRSFHATPTNSSEASWNSQAGLLSNPHGSAAISIENLPNHGDRNTRTARWFLRRKCPCSGEKSVQVQERNSEYKIQQKVQLKRTNSAGSSSYPNGNNSPRTFASYSAAAKAMVPSSATPDHNHCNGNFKLQPRLDHESKIMNQIQNPNLNGFSSSIGLSAGHNQVVRAFVDSNGNTAAATDSNCFTFPVLNSSAPQVQRMFHVIPPPLADAGVDDPARDSLEVFQPRESLHSNARERSCHFTYPTSPTSRRMSYDDEIGSDASSDLFEIESFSTQTTTYPRRDSMDDNSSYGASRFMITTANVGTEPRPSLDEPMTPSVAPSECYAPSEVSVVWSVATAEGFERASLSNFSVAAASEVDYGGGRCISTGDISGGGGGGGGGDVVGGGRRRGNGGLLSCRCEKAVSVGPGPIKCGVDTAMIGPGLQSQNMVHVNGRAQPTASKPPPVRSRSSLVSRSFAT
ncbi:hypothetical protein Dimus_002043 [Dionaea muscipula]